MLKNYLKTYILPKILMCIVCILSIISLSFVIMYYIAEYKQYGFNGYAFSGSVTLVMQVCISILFILFIYSKPKLIILPIIPCILSYCMQLYYQVRNIIYVLKFNIFSIEDYYVFIQ